LQRIPDLLSGVFADVVPKPFVATAMDPILDRSHFDEEVF
jgi:hypothetical protein